MDKQVTVTYDGRIEGYLTLPEIAEKNGITPEAVRTMLHRGEIESLVIGYDKHVLHWLPENTIIPKRKRGRPKKINDETEMAWAKWKNNIEKSFKEKRR